MCVELTYIINSARYIQTHTDIFYYDIRWLAFLEFWTIILQEYVQIFDVYIKTLCLFGSAIKCDWYLSWWLEERLSKCRFCWVIDYILKLKIFTLGISSYIYLCIFISMIQVLLSYRLNSQRENFPFEK